jgi:hypothetical protein
VPSESKELNKITHLSSLLYDGIVDLVKSPKGAGKMEEDKDELAKRGENWEHVMTFC